MHKRDVEAFVRDTCFIPLFERMGNYASMAIIPTPFIERASDPDPIVNFVHTVNTSMEDDTYEKTKITLRRTKIEERWFLCKDPS
jgi:hypothetical protein